VTLWLSVVTIGRNFLSGKTLNTAVTKAETVYFTSRNDNHLLSLESSDIAIGL